MLIIPTLLFPLTRLNQKMSLVVSKVAFKPCPKLTLLLLWTAASVKKKGFKLCPANPLIPRDSVVPVPLPGFFSFHLYVITSPHKYHLHGDGTLLTTTETLIIRCALTTVSHVSNVALGVLLLSGKKIHILTDIGLSDSHKMLYTFMVLREWSLLMLVIPWHFLHQQVGFWIYPITNLTIYLMDWHITWYRNSCFPDDVSFSSRATSRLTLSVQWKVLTNIRLIAIMSSIFSVLIAKMLVMLTLI